MAAVVLRRDPAASSADTRLIDATLRCIARWGISKTTLDDVAREARCSRATVYRSFPGGKSALLDTVLDVEVERFLTRLRDRLSTAADLEDALVAVMVEAGTTIAAHDALHYLLEHEQDLVLPRLAFKELDELLAAIRAVGGPLLARFVADPATAERAAEWVARLTLSYTLSPAAGFDTADEVSVRTLVTTFVLPGLLSPIDS
ncbi:MAG TPA: helix-turn-helix domain-containing protein [Acidimicrobiales bacterium]